MAKEAFVAHDDATGASKHNRVVEEVFLDEVAHLLEQVDASFLATHTSHVHRIEQIGIGAPEVDEPEMLAQRKVTVLKEAVGEHSTRVVPVTWASPSISTLVVRVFHERERHVASAIRR